MLRFLVDENSPLQLEELLKQKGFDAVHVKTAKLSGTKDPELYRWAQQESRIIISRDMGWANIMTYPPGSHAGLIILRLPYNAVTAEIMNAFESFLDKVNIDQLPGALVIVEKIVFDFESICYEPQKLF